jgi:hypothetical protein
MVDMASEIASFGIRTVICNSCGGHSARGGARDAENEKKEKNQAEKKNCARACDAGAPLAEIYIYIYIAVYNRYYNI